MSSCQSGAHSGRTLWGKPAVQIVVPFKFCKAVMKAPHVLKERASSHGLEAEDMRMTGIVGRYKNRPEGADFDEMYIAKFSLE